MNFEGGGAITFSDPRRLGQARIGTTSEIDGLLLDARLGPEPWPDPLPAEAWRDRLQGTRRSLKECLMDQGKVAGLGNIAASEICFRAQIHPRTSPNDLGDEAWTRLSEAAAAHLESTLAQLEKDGLELLSSNRKAAHSFLVYGRSGEPCPSCRAPILAVRQGGRSTFFCERCQR